MNLQSHAYIQPHEKAWLEGSRQLNSTLELSLHNNILAPVREGLANLNRLALEQLQSEEEKRGLSASSNQTWEEKLEWCLRQRAFAEMAQVLEKELSDWFHPNPTFNTPYREADLSTASDWLAKQKQNKATVSELENLVKTLPYRLPYFSIPYDSDLVAEQAEILFHLSERWSRFDALERRWATLEYTRAYSVTEREDLDFRAEEAYCTEQEELWADYQSYVQQYKSMGLSAKVYRVPIDKDTFVIHRDNDDFVNHWSKELQQHKAVLMPWYRSRVSFPTAPFTGEDIEGYVRDVRPYLKRSKQIRFWSPIGAVAIGILGLSARQYSLHLDAIDLEKRAGEIGWSLDIAAPPYAAGKIEHNRALLKESERLYPQVLDLEKRARALGWSLEIPGPYDEVVVLGHAAKISESEGNQNRAEALSLVLGQAIDFPWLTAKLDRLEGIHSEIKAVEVSAGRFMMGCLPSDHHCDPNEKPRHKVLISHDMIVMSTEVTQGLYERVMGSNPSHFSSCGKDCPVEQVSWYDAVGFANKLSEELGLSVCYRIEGKDVTWSNADCLGWRLPTEAEWEYCARGGAEQIYSGSDEVDTVAWYSGNGGRETLPVSQKSANGFGLYDMSGNVFEWTWDIYGDYSSESLTDPQGSSRRSERVHRGACNIYDAYCTRNSKRGYSEPAHKYDNLGFRLLRVKNDP